MAGGPSASARTHRSSLCTAGLSVVIWAVLLGTCTATSVPDAVLVTVSSGGVGWSPNTPLLKVATPAAAGAARWAWSCCSSAPFTSVLRDSLGLAAVTASLLIYGLLQERIMTIGFGPSSELFDNSIFLVLCNRLVTCFLAFGYMAISGAPSAPAAPLRSYGAVSFTNVVATTCQYEALKYVSFGMQTLAKSAKAMPVMLWGTVYSGKRYRVSDYLHAGVITAGCTAFMLSGDVGSRTQAGAAHSDPTVYMMGAALMVLYLAVDGLTSTWQDSLFSGYNMGICDQVLYTTAFSAVLSFTAAVVTGQLLPSILFVMRHPDALVWILALSGASAAVQLVISFTIKQYGAVVFATIMTTRQFFSVLLSSLVFMTPLTVGQWLGTAVIFAAIYVKVVRQTRQSRAPRAVALEKPNA